MIHSEPPKSGRQGIVKRILLVEDEQPILAMYTDFLKRLDCETDTANTLTAAFDHLQRSSYGIVITDKNMGDSAGGNEGGMELLRHVREQSPATEVIMITGFADVASAVEAMKLGAFDYLVKPVPLKELRHKIERIWDYQRFSSSADTLQTYRTLLRQVLHHLINEDQLAPKHLEEILRTLGTRIDHLFGLQGELEKIIDKQTATLEAIEDQIEALRGALPADSPYQEWLENILTLSQERV